MADPEGAALRAPIEAERQALEDALTAGLSIDERANLLKALRTVQRTAMALRDDT
jgi:DNA-binding MarR family transcriptional regulator